MAAGALASIAAIEGSSQQQQDAAGRAALAPNADTTDPSVLRPDGDLTCMHAASTRPAFKAQPLSFFSALMHLPYWPIRYWTHLPRTLSLSLLAPHTLELLQ